MGVIVQARMSSRRLPGKVMLPLDGVPVIGHVVNRARKIVGTHSVVVATSTHESDDLVEDWCLANGVLSFRGPLNDVVSRYHQCAVKFGFDTVVRVTADCPLLDPEVSSQVLEAFVSTQPDMAGLAGSFPDGLDTTVVSAESLAQVAAVATLPSHREHLPLFYDENASVFSIRGVEPFSGMSHYRWTLDNPRDYSLLCTLASLVKRPLSEVRTADIIATYSKYEFLHGLN